MPPLRREDRRLRASLLQLVEIDRTPQADRTAALLAAGIALAFLAALLAVLALVIL